MTQYISFILVAVLLLVATDSWAQKPPYPVEFIPTLYVTSTPERPQPKQQFVYQANLCNTSVYANYMVIARVNLPSGWRPFIGQLAKLQICTDSTCSKCLCTNFPGGRFNGQHNCSLAYNTSLSALYAVVTASDSPNIDWTVALEFLPKAEFKEKYIGQEKADQIKYDDEISEPIPINKVTEASVKALQQIVPPGSKHSVTTLNRQDFRLAFCPDAGTTQRYNVDIVVTALDSLSAMATYVCLPPVDPKVGCTPGTALHSDPRGIGINVVTLSTGSGSLSDVYVVVVGWGDGEQENNFLIGATISKY